MILGNETENRKYSAQFYTLNLGSTTTSAANVEELHNRMTKNSPKVDLNLSIF
jgi:hypothetical protein